MTPALTKVFGPPGTGKTTFIIEEIIKRGIPLGKVAFISFTTKAILEVRARIDRDMPTHITNDDIQFFKTQHSMNKSLLGVVRDDLVVGEEKMREFAKEQKVTFSLDFYKKLKNNKYEHAYTEQQEEQSVTREDTIEDEFYYEMQKERIALLPSDYVPAHLRHCADVYLRFKRKYFSWMDEHGYIDFNGLIEKGIEEKVVPNVDLLCVDEWQDMSPLLVKQINIWTQHIPQSIHAGDDDQTIFEWAGARPDDFLKFPTFECIKEEIILKKTYRLPKNILELSKRVIARNHNRVRKGAVHAMKEEEGVLALMHIDQIAEFLKRTMETKSTIILVRCSFIKSKITDDLIKYDVPIINIPYSHLIALDIIYRAHKQQYVTQEQLSVLASTSIFPTNVHIAKKKNKGKTALRKLIDVKNGGDISFETLREYGVTDKFFYDIEHNIYSNLNIKSLNKILPLYKKYGSEYKSIKISTIHNQKGSEFDTVIIVSDSTKKISESTRKSLQKKEEERRVWYTGITRPKENLIFLDRSFTRYSNHESLIYKEIASYIKYVK